MMKTMFVILSLLLASCSALELPKLLLTSVDVRSVDVGSSEVEFDAYTAGAENEAVCLVDVREKSRGRFRKPLFLATKVDFATFKKRVRQEAKKIKARNVMVHTHGFNVQPGGFFEAVDKGRKILENEKILLVPVLWPCTKLRLPSFLGFVAYPLDQNNVPDGVSEQLVPLLELFAKIDEAVYATSIMCHSMGNYVLRWLAQKARERRLWQRLLRRKGPHRRMKHVFMVAPDVRYDIFDEEKNSDMANPEENPGKCIAKLCTGKVFVLHSSKDTAMVASNVQNWKNALGRRGFRESKLHPDLKGKVVNVNCDDYNTIGGTAHGYQWTPGVVQQVYAKNLA